MNNIDKLQKGIIHSMGGGGSTSGAVSYPTYMMDYHAAILDKAATETLDAGNSSFTLMNAAIGNSPWAAAGIYDPDADITAWEAAITAFAATLAGVDPATDWAALFAAAGAVIAIGDATVADMADIASEAVITADSLAFSDNLDDELTVKVLPRYRGGMRDINAVVSSSFVVGEALIESFRTRDVAKHESALRLHGLDIDLEVGKANLTKDVDVAKINMGKDVQVETMIVESTNQMLQVFLNTVTWEESYMRAVVESRRIKIVAKTEEEKYLNEVDVTDALWDLEMLKFGSNLLGAIAGSQTNPGTSGPSKLQTAMGGAMAGGAMGAAMAGAQAGGMTGPQGAVIGAAVGFAAYYLMS